MVQKNDGKFRKFSLVLVFVSLSFFLFSACAELEKIFKPTSVERDTYQPECKRSWKGKTIYIDFRTNSYYWNHRYASGLAAGIRDKLIEDIVEDGCFNVQDTRSRRNYLYKVSVRITSPRIRVRNRIIQHVSAAFRVKTYDSRNNLITAKTRRVKYDAPQFVMAINNSQEELLENYAYNVSIRIRKSIYQSFGGRAKNLATTSGKYKTTRTINFRSGPSTKTLIIMKLPKNTPVHPTGKTKGRWWQVEAKGERGWLHSKYIRKQ